MTEKEESLFVQFFGDYPIIRVLDFLLENRFFDYSRKEIAKQTGIGTSTIHTFWDKLLKFGIIVETRKIDRASLYALNTESPLVKELAALEMKLCFPTPVGAHTGQKPTAVPA